MSVSGYKSRPDCELLENRPLIKDPSLYVSAAAEGFTGPKQGHSIANAATSSYSNQPKP